MDLVIQNWGLIIVIINRFVVARDGIEPPTHGYSVLATRIISVTQSRNPCTHLRTNNFNPDMDKSVNI